MTSPVFFGKYPHAAAAYDASRKSIVIFGPGQNAPATWTFDGTTITKLPNTGGTTSGYYSMSPDDATSTVSLFGSNVDAWTWDGSKWTAQNPAHSPPARSGAGLAYDRPMHHVVLFGGLDGHQMPLNVIWTSNGSDWTQVSAT